MRKQLVFTAMNSWSSATMRKLYFKWRSRFLKRKVSREGMLNKMLKMPVSIKCIMRMMINGVVIERRKGYEAMVEYKLIKQVQDKWI